MPVSPTAKTISKLHHRARRGAAVIAISLLAFAFFSTLAEFTLTGDALAQENRCVSGEGDPPCPVVTLESISPSGSVREGTRLTVTARIDRPLSATSTGYIHGGIMVFDSCEPEPDNQCIGPEFSHLIALRFWPGQETNTASHRVVDDGVEPTSNRTITIRLHPGWDDHNVDETAELRVTVIDKDSDQPQPVVSPPPPRPIFVPTSTPKPTATPTHEDRRHPRPKTTPPRRHRRIPEPRLRLPQLRPRLSLSQLPRPQRNLSLPTRRFPHLCLPRHRRRHQRPLRRPLPRRRRRPR